MWGRGRTVHKPTTRQSAWTVGGLPTSPLRGKVLGVEGDVVVDERGDEKVRVVVALLRPRRVFVGL